MARPSSKLGQHGRHRVRHALESLEDRVTPSTLALTVTSRIDSNAPNSGSLRRAITDANASNFDFCVIEIKTPGQYSLSINGSNEDANATGDLDVMKTSTIVNDSGGVVEIDGGGLTDRDRVFDIGPNGEDISVILKGVSIQNGRSPAGGGIRVPGPADLELDHVILENNKDGGGGGGGIFMLDGDLIIQDSAVRENIATGSGGGVFQSGNGRLRIVTSFIANNQSQGTAAGQGGGGVRYDGTGDVTLNASYFDGNMAAGNGGGFLNTHDARLTIAASTFFNNRSNRAGGGLFLATGVASTITNVTITSNVAKDLGGGLDANGTGGIITLQNDTIVFNTAQSAGGVFAGATSLRLVNTIVAKNTSGSGANPDLEGLGTNSIVDLANNFVGDNTGAGGAFPAGTPNTHGSFVGTAAAPLDPLLGPLAGNDSNISTVFGISPPTHASLPNNGNNGVRDRGIDLGAPTTDERFFTRPSGRHVDIGAFELQYPDMTVTASGPTGTNRAGSPLDLTFTVTNKGFKPSSGVALAITLPADTSFVTASVGFTVSGNVVTLAVPDLAAGAAATLALTVTAGAGGPFSATAALGVDPDLTNNTANVSLTLLPKPIPATGSADVTKLVTVKLRGKQKAAKTEHFILTNTSTKAIQGPLGVVAVFPARINLKNASGATAKKQKFLRVTPGSDSILDPGESVAFNLVFSKAFLPKQFHVLAGKFA